MALTRKGLLVQMISLVATYTKYKHLQSENDCKVALNPVVRAYGKELVKVGHVQITRSTKAHPKYKGKVVEDHVIPVKALMEHILKWPSHKITNRNLRSLEKWLSQHILIAKITAREHSKLTELKLGHRMPFKWGTALPRSKKGKWARYSVADICGNIPLE